MSKDYDRSIHSNPDALAWAKFFMETINDIAKEKGKVHLQTLIDESYMLGWFANAMMAKSDHVRGNAEKDVADLVQAGKDTLQLFEAWRDGVFAGIGIKWKEEPPAIKAMREALSKVTAR